MADLTYVQSAAPVSIIGTDSAGVETNAVGADSNGNLLVKNYSVGPVTPGTVASGSSLIGAQFNTSLPTLTNGQQSALQADSSGRLLIGAIPAGANIIGAVTQSGSWTVAATQSGTWTVAQGTAAALSGAWPVKVTDGTNTMPTMDAVGRAGFMKVTDGTNTMPTMDAVGRAGFLKVTDGTNTAAVKAASTAAVAADPALVVAISPNNTLTVTGSELIVDNAAFTDGTSKVSMAGYILDEVAGTALSENDAGAARMDSKRAQVMVVEDATTRGQRQAVTAAGAASVNLAQVAGTTTVTGGLAGSQGVGGLAATGAALSGNPVLVGGSDGTDVRNVATDANGVQYVSSLAEAVGRARITGTTSVSLGRLSTNATTKVRMGMSAFTDETAGAQRSVVSSSAADASAGTGARTIKITYYTVSAGVISGPSTETITMNGTTNVNTVATNICHVEKIEVITVGTGLTNAGTISLFASTAGGGGTIATIPTGDKVTKYGHHFVPSGKTCLVYDFSMMNNASSGNTPEITVEVSDPASANNAEVIIQMFRLDGRSGVNYNPTVPLTVVGPARIRIYVTPENTPIQITSVSFSFVEA